MKIKFLGKEKTTHLDHGAITLKKTLGGITLKKM